MSISSKHSKRFAAITISLINHIPKLLLILFSLASQSSSFLNTKLISIETHHLKKFHRQHRHGLQPIKRHKLCSTKTSNSYKSFYDHSGTCNPKKSELYSKPYVDDIPTTIETTRNDNDTVSATEKKSTETLRFGGTYSYTSQKFSLPNSKSNYLSIDRLYEFLNKEEIQHILLSGGTNSTIHKILRHQLDDTLIEKWSEKVSEMNGSAPNPDEDSVVIVTPPGIDIFTVSVIPTTTIGTKLIRSKDNNDANLNLPEFQAILIEDEPRAIGPKFFVWLFNKITYGGNPNESNIVDSGMTRRKEAACLRLTVKIIEPKNDELYDDVKREAVDCYGINFVFTAESSMMLEFDFPRGLLRFFPMKKDKAEKICSGAILKALEKNMLPAMDAFCKKYIEVMNEIGA